VQSGIRPRYLYWNRHDHISKKKKKVSYHNHDISILCYRYPQHIYVQKDSQIYSFHNHHPLLLSHFLSKFPCNLCCLMNKLDTAANTAKPNAATHTPMKLSTYASKTPSYHPSGNR
jgi:predicted PolB exonuclease-like 3'-5' exonuclease